MNERIELSAAIETRRAAEALNQHAAETLARAGEYVATIEDELAALQARNQAEIAQHGRQLVESFRAGVDGAVPAQSSTGSLLIEAERKYAAAAAAYGELERELEQARDAAKESASRTQLAAVAVLRDEGDAIAAQILEHEKQAGELRAQLKAIDALSSGFAPGVHRFFTRQALDAIVWPGKEPLVPRSALLENVAIWRAHFDALQIDADDLLRS